MSNLYKPHLLVLPEDEANQQLVNGIIKSQNINYRAVIIDKPLGGWKDVIKKYIEDEVPKMREYDLRIAVLLIDFDCDTINKSTENRLNQVIKKIPEDLRDRTFVLGTLDEPEALKKKLKFSLSLEKIGETLAEDCPDKQNPLWNDDMLKHNAPELKRLVESAKHFLFSK
ncbi:MAG: hypothetical protein HGA81_06855 [Chlorobium limicola]|nr:hypothetical protein [Chlorobium limicola]